MFRARPGGVWQCCGSCYHWPDDCEDFHDDCSRVSVETMCAICLCLDVTGTGDNEEPAYSSGAAALNSRLRKQWDRDGRPMTKRTDPDRREVCVSRAATLSKV